MIGQSIIRLIPPELRAEEDEILAKLRRGERVDHFETVRMAKDGRRLDISVTVSPLRNKAGEIVGASKVARDITERKQSAALQRLLFEELNHRVKNTLAIDPGDRQPVAPPRGEPIRLRGELRRAHPCARPRP